MPPRNRTVNPALTRRQFIQAFAAAGAAVPARAALAAARKERTLTEVDFIDARWIAHTYFLTRSVTQPARVSDEPIIAPASSPSTIVPTAGGGCMWYSSVRWVKQPKGDKVHQHWIHFATTKDGVTFDRPDLGLREGNVILQANERDAHGRPINGSAGCKGLCVLDAEASRVPHARARYTGFFLSNPSGSPAGLCLICSDDGLRWRAYPENPLYTGWPDTYNNFFYDERIRRYVAYIRPNFHAGRTHANRCMARIESEDMVRWGNEQIVLDTDDADAPAVGAVNEAKDHDGTEYPRGRNKQFYGMTVQPHQGLYLGFASFYDVVPGTMWIELVHSYDGVEWRREPKREALVPLGAEGAWDAGIVYYPGVGCPFAVGDDWFIYYSGTNFDHHHQIRSRKALGQFRAIGAARLKRGRLIGYQARGEPGDLLTKTFEWQGAALALNADASRGRIRVQVCHPNGHAIKGFSRSDAVPIQTDNVCAPVQFRSSASLAPLRGRQVRLRVFLEDATLFGMAFG